MDKYERYKKNFEERDTLVKNIIESKATKKIIVAGPGTGKTHLFKKILEGKKRCLTLSFVNSLVEELSLELYGLSQVKTLHGFARSELSRISEKKIEISSKIQNVIKEDARILADKNFHFERIFHELIDDVDAIEFYKRRRQYYKYYGYSDIIYGLIKCYEKNPRRIPSYDQILVDEFQDFNQLEVKLIDMLAEKSPILIVGDDDQALYEFKSASTEFIRKKRHDDKAYTSFELPYCGRCTKIIVNSLNEFINNAIAKGHLTGRVDKTYKYFENKEKDNDSSNFDYINYSQVFAKRIPWFIVQMISIIAKTLRQKFSVLIITPYRIQAQSIIKGLKSYGLQNIEYDSKNNPEVSLLDGLLILLDDFTSNLGWRIVLKYFLSDVTFIAILKNTQEDPEKELFEQINPDLKKKIKKLVTSLKAVYHGNQITEENLQNLLSAIQFDSKSAIIENLRGQLAITTDKVCDAAIKKIPIKVSTIQSSKGLSGDFVFITHLDDQYYFESKMSTVITDHEICNFLVALSRTKKQVFLISSQKIIPEFLKWIPDENIKRIEV